MVTRCTRTSANSRSRYGTGALTRRAFASPHAWPCFRPCHVWYCEWRQYGPVVSIGLPGRMIVSIADPAAIARILRRPRVFGRSKFFQAAFAHVANGLLVLEGAKWQQHRRLLQPVFHARNLRTVVDATNGACTQLFSGWESRYPDGKAVPVHQLYALVSMDVIGRVGFGLDFGCVRSQLLEAHDSTQAPLMQEVIDVLFRGVEKRISLPPVLWRFLSDNTVYEMSRT